MVFSAKIDERIDTVALIAEALRIDDMSSARCASLPSIACVTQERKRFVTEILR